MIDNISLTCVKPQGINHCMLRFSTKKKNLFQTLMAYKYPMPASPQARLPRS